jgi:hypothetical protein
VGLVVAEKARARGGDASLSDKACSLLRAAGGDPDELLRLGPGEAWQRLFPADETLSDG